MKHLNSPKAVISAIILSLISPIHPRPATIPQSPHITISTTTKELHSRTKPKRIHQNSLEQRISYLMENSISHHIEQGHIEEEGLLLYLNPEEYIAPEGQGIGVNASNLEGTGDDIEVSRQRQIHLIEYNTLPKTMHYEVIDEFPCRTARRGFGFRCNSLMTPTGLFHLYFQNRTAPYRTASETYSNITTATTALKNICDEEGNPIYEETSEINDVFSRRKIVIHSRENSREDEFDITGSDGCVLIPNEDNWRLAKDILPRYENAYIFIAGQSPEDLPQYERQLMRPSPYEHISNILWSLENATKELIETTGQHLGVYKKEGGIVLRT